MCVIEHAQVVMWKKIKLDSLALELYFRIQGQCETITTCDDTLVWSGLMIDMRFDQICVSCKM